MNQTLSDAALDQIFRAARTHNAFDRRPVTDSELKAIFDLMKWAPTSANGSPARFLFVRGAQAKQRLGPHLAPGNAEKTMAAPVTVIVGHDLEFYRRLDKLFPHEPGARAWFEGKSEHVRVTAFRNGTLQGAYFLIAARALGYDCGPMSGFNNDGVDAEFFAGTSVRSNFLINLGHGDPDKLFPRSPRLDFAEACAIL